MDNAVTGADEISFAAEVRAKPIVNGGDCTTMVVLRERLPRELLPGVIGDFETRRRGADAFDLTMRPRNHRTVSRGVKRREFDARRPGIKYKDRTVHRRSVFQDNEDL
jgi:hypothetical protein